ncbi:MAG: ribulose-phosphate 3-epimerase [Anaerostipes sp.]|jgi:ribulose-phosphate 3-epimerase|nr:ribulose-phosphate 3-epimerase [Anaerostipes sp.]
MKQFSSNFPAISASVSCMDLLHLENQIKEIEESDISFFHYDVVDGRFNQCFILGDTLLEQMSKATKLPIEVHLAVYNPEEYIERFAKAGADYITVQYESLTDPKRTFDMIRSFGCQPGICYKSTTAPQDDFVEIAKDVSWILKLTVNPGFSGQKIQSQSIEHIKEMKSLLFNAGLSTPIQADGNVNLETIPSLASAGASIFTGGTSGLFLKDNSIAVNVRDMLKKASENYHR